MAELAIEIGISVAGVIGLGLAIVVDHFRGKEDR